jgi:hypothetical protein
VDGLVFIKGVSTDRLTVNSRLVLPVVDPVDPDTNLISGDFRAILTSCDLEDPSFTNKGYVFEVTALGINKLIKVYLGGELVFSFIDYISKDLTYFIRVCGDYRLYFLISDTGENKLVNITETFSNIKPLKAEVPSKNLLSDFGVIDIETFVDEENIKPYAVGVYHNNSFISFYRTDYVDESQMFMAVFDYLNDKGIKVL